MAKVKKTSHLDTEEKDLDSALDLLNVADLSKPGNAVQKKFRGAAKEFIRKETKMNIRIDPVQLEEIKIRAGREGLKYQALVKSVLHKYITGQLTEKKAV